MGGVAAVEAPASADASSHLRSSGRLLVGRLLAVLLSGLAQVVAVRGLSVPAYGVLALGLTSAEVVHRVTSLVHGQATPRYLALYEDRRDAPRLVGTLTLATAAITVLTGLVLLLGLVFREPVTTGLLHGDSTAATVLLLLVVYGGGEAFDDLAGAALAALDRANAIFWRRYVLGPGLRLALTVVVLAAGGGVVGLALAYTLLELAGVALYAWVLLVVLRQRSLLVRRPVLPTRELLLFGLPLISVEVYNVCQQLLGPLLLAGMRGPVDVAQLRAVAPLATLNLLVIYTFTTMWTPLATRLAERGDLAGLQEAYWTCTRWLLVLSFPVFALTVPLAGPVTSGVLGDRYAVSAPVLALLATGYFFNAATGLNAATAIALGRTRQLLLVNLGCSAFVVALDVVLIPRYGARGAALAILLSVVVQNLLVQRVLRVAGIPLVTRDHLVLVGQAVALAAVAAVLASVVGLPLAVALLLAAACGLALLALQRDSMRAGDLFPELRRVPGVGRFV